MFHCEVSRWWLRCVSDGVSDLAPRCTRSPPTRLFTPDRTAPPISKPGWEPYARALDFGFVACDLNEGEERLLARCPGAPHNSLSRSTGVSEIHDGYMVAASNATNTSSRRRTRRS